MQLPPDLDRPAKRKYRELAELLGLDFNPELLANHCRQHSSLISIRAERAKQQASGVFQTMLPGRDGAQQINPLITAEGRLIASLNRSLKTLGITPDRDEPGRSSKSLPNPPPPGLRGPEPAYGWQLERALCGDPTNFLPGGKHGTKD